MDPVDMFAVYTTEEREGSEFVEFRLLFVTEDKSDAEMRAENEDAMVTSLESFIDSVADEEYSRGVSDVRNGLY